MLLAGAAVVAAFATGAVDRLRPAGLPAGVVARSSETPTDTRLADPGPPLVAAAVSATTAPTATAPTPAATPAATAIPATTPSTPSPGLAASPAPSSSGAVAPLVVHVVKSGESLTSIAAQYGVTPQAIKRANSLKDANLLRIGQKLIIPAAR